MYCLCSPFYLNIRYKFWSCCQRRTSDFNEFQRQEGCSTGDHLWTKVVCVCVCGDALVEWVSRVQGSLCVGRRVLHWRSPLD